MTSIHGISTSRVSETLDRDALLANIQAQRAALFRAQSQISTGQKYALPSENPSQSLQGVATQILLQRQAQIQTNLNSTASFVDNSSSVLANIQSQITSIRAQGLSAVGVSAAERATAVQQLNATIDSLLRSANTDYGGRYLFAGAKISTVPFVTQGDFIQYQGDTQRLASFSDIGSLIDSNVNGDETFGALSSGVVGSADLNPTISDDTPLSDLRNGQGISKGSIAVSDGVYKSVVDISGAVTVGDVARLLEKYPPGYDQTPPSGRTLTARVTPSGIQITLNGGNLTVADVASGVTAGQLGLRGLGGAGPGPFLGEDLNARLTRTTPLSNLLGQPPRAYLSLNGQNNDLVVQSTSNGPAANGVTVKLVNDAYFQGGPGLLAGGEVASFSASATAAVAALRLPGADNDLKLTAVTPGLAFNDVQIDLVNGGSIGNTATANYSASSPKTLTLTIDGTGATQIDTLITAINNSGFFTAARDTSGPDANLNSAATIPASGFGANLANTYNTGSAANTLVVRIAPSSSTALHVIDAINATGTFQAALDQSELGNDGLGAVNDTFSEPTATGTLAGGTGENLDLSSGIQIVNGGKTYTVTFTEANTVDDLLNAINGAGAGVVARINDRGDGLNIQSNLSGADFSIGENGGTTATQLGIRSLNQTTALSGLNHGYGVERVGGGDFRITRSDGVGFDIDLDSGTYATASFNGGSTNDALIFSSKTPGTTGNTFAVQLVDGGSGSTNSVTLVGNTLQFSVDVAAGFTASNAIALLNASPLASSFAARLDTTTDPGNTGSSNLAATGPTSFAGGRSSTLTIADVLNVINNHPTNLASGNPLVAQLNTVGNGIQLVDKSGGSGTLSVSALASSNTAVDLGLIAPGELSSAEPTVSGSSQVLAGSDVNPQEVRGLFNAVLRLRDAIEANDPKAIARAIELLDESTQTHLNPTQAALGIRGQNLDDLKAHWQDQNVILSQISSDFLDADLTESISNLLALQTSYEAALRAAGTLSKLSLLNFI